MTSLLDQFKDHIAAKSREALLKLRAELLTRSVGGGERSDTEREVSIAYAKAIDEELATQDSKGVPGSAEQFRRWGKGQPLPPLEEERGDAKAL